MQKLQRTFKIGEEVVLRDMCHMEDKDVPHQEDVWVSGMTEDFNKETKFKIIKRIKDKWYRISRKDKQEWQVRYNWIESIDQIKKIEQKEEGPIAKILWDALTYLQIDDTYNKDRHIENNYSSQFTCDCIDLAAFALGLEENLRAVFKFLESLGFDEFEANSFNCFDEFKKGEERQGARFQWLYTAYWIAKDLGI